MKEIFSAVDAIDRRRSVRNYSSSPVEQPNLQTIAEYIRANTRGPLGSAMRFALVDGSGFSAEEIKGLGTYGLIRGARLFIAGAVEKNTRAMEDYGYCMEKNILLATSLGLGTCWLGGTLDRGAFGELLGLRSNEIIPAVTPVGHAESGKLLRDQTASFLMRSRHRKKSGRLFFNRTIDNPVDMKQDRELFVILESVRHAPSAGNLQPWRIVKTGDAYHFFLDENPLYNNYCDIRYHGVRLQNVDMGIAMAHFELAANESGWRGNWIVSEPHIEKGSLIYIASWMKHGDHM